MKKNDIQKQLFDEHAAMLDVLKTVRIAFADGGSHIERVSALVDVDKVLNRIHGVSKAA